MSERLNSMVASWLLIKSEVKVLWLRIFCPIRIGVKALVTRMFICLKAGEFRSPTVMSQFSSLKVVILPFMPLTSVSECVMCFSTSSGNQEIGMMLVEHPESSIAVSEKVVPLTVKVALMNWDCCVVCC